MFPDKFRQHTENDHDNDDAINRASVIAVFQIALLRFRPMKSVETARIHPRIQTRHCRSKLGCDDEVPEFWSNTVGDERGKY